jgi:hypothetical protein
MSSFPRRALALTALALIVLASCARPFGRQYEYEEEIFIALDGSASMIVNGSLAALAALHGLDVPLDPTAPIDRDQIRAFYTSPVTAVTRVSGQYFSFVAEDGPKGLVARQRPVQVGDLIGNDYVVLGGLKPGDRVVTAGIQKIGEGAPIRAE